MNQWFVWFNQPFPKERNPLKEFLLGRSSKLRYLKLFGKSIPLHIINSQLYYSKIILHQFEYLHFSDFSDLSNQDYNVSIEYYWAPFIVESISDHATNHTVLKRMVKLDSIANHGNHWKGVDVLVFESYVWWRYKPLINAT